ncbi:MAG: mechanosensitive ion channel family protein [Microcoleaceae cyanobacterium]
MDQSLIIWSFILIFGVPLLALLLGECLAVFEKRGSALTPVVRNLRRYILPLVAVLVVMQQLLKLSNTELSVRLVQTGFWLAAIVTLLTLVNAVLTPNEPKPGSFQLQIPNLFFQAARAAVILLLLGQLITNTWQIDLGGIIQALGVGSLVIALALQDTLSNLVSGFLLLFSSPFKVGDWIEVGGTQGRVSDLNWRAVTISNTGFGYDIVIPNGTLAKSTITNYARGGSKIWGNVQVGFSYDHPPSQVIAMLEEAAKGIPFLEGPFPIVDSYDDSAINYAFWFKCIPEKKFGVTAKLTNRIFYAAKRYSLEIPYPISVQYKINGLPQRQQNPQQQMLTFLRSLPYLTTLNPQMIQQLSEEVKLRYYANGEQIIRAGEPDEGLYILQNGSVVLTVEDARNEEKQVDLVADGEFFGEMALLPGELSPVSATAVSDVTVIVINHLTAKTMIDTNPRFAVEMNQFIEERKKAVQLAQGVDTIAVASQNGKKKKKSLIDVLSLEKFPNIPEDTDTDSDIE